MTRLNAIVVVTMFVGCNGGVISGGEDDQPIGLSLMPVVDGKVSAPPMRQNAADGTVAISSTGNGISYNGGPIMSGTTSLYYIWYGNWNGNSARGILSDFADGIGFTPNYFVNDTYDDS